MKKQLLFFASLVMLNIANAQSSVHQTAYFSSTGSGGAGIVTNYMGGFANDKSRTFEAWVKRDTVDGDYHTIIYAPDFSYPSTRSILYMYLLGDSVYASYGSFSNGGYYPPDTNWHHISYETEPNIIHDTVITYDTLTGLTHITITISDSNTLYIDGVFAGSRKGSHTSVMSIRNCRIESFKFYPCFIICKLPIDFCLLIVTILLPCIYFICHSFYITYSSIEALPHQNIQFYFCHV